MSVSERCKSCGRFKKNCFPKTSESEKLCDSYAPPIDNSGIFRKIFSHRGRIRRFEYCLSYILFQIVYIGYELISVSNSGSSIHMFFALLTLIFVVIMILQGIKRSHDLGHSGSWILIPIYSPFWLLFAQGEEGVNEYGTDPRQSYNSQVFNEEKYLKNHQSEIGEE